jgi:opacity protein-like surface antigen
VKTPRLCSLALATILACGLAAPARAQVSIGGHASYTKSDGADGTWWGGAQLRIRFGPLGVEGLADYRRTTYSALGVDVLRVEQYPVQASAMIFILSGPVQPYILGGGGWYFTRSTHLGPDALLGHTTEHKFGSHAGGGVDFRLAKHVSIHADVRYVFLTVSSVQDIKDRYHNNPKADFWHGTTGLNFSF